MATLVKLFKKYQSQIAYLFFGGVTTVVNIVVFAVANSWWHWNYQVANILAWLLSVLVAYITNKLWVFSSHAKGFRENMREITSFFGFRILTLLFEVVILFVGITLLHGNNILVKIIDQVIVIVSNYFFSKWYIFKTNDFD
ncbi:MAG: GtrA family protein [Furfurilactobacillus sp.]|jgi:putative flippase GtrA|uniref:GtrA family protein n=1 Tax=Furfurilactobacillus milii TaxID=2888272 RepID=A0ABT6D9G8_9LACO|nr:MULTISPECIES: GtrA family protein [Furfurilactobacillus]MCF6160760.1 GtrA family protein [Furfurilactobacillus milii]MCF6163046.1 GtrA family protein [Furfurilactobacillus milii]MCF6165347.1 GtrA family protein [Furfurilactobacillus rossiae]MCF6419755.1 GtrA family protein [Furfurilactobacillus milii]MCH4012659.1 GtrA family protein [Furfurilactobacillus sp.]